MPATRIQQHPRPSFLTGEVVKVAKGLPSGGATFTGVPIVSPTVSPPSQSLGPSAQSWRK
jgi:hypothetical protein